jgi:hypothetical protein
MVTICDASEVLRRRKPLRIGPTVESAPLPSLSLRLQQLLSRTERRRLPASGMLPATCMKLRCATVLKPLR